VLLFIIIGILGKKMQRLIAIIAVCYLISGVTAAKQTLTTFDYYHPQANSKYVSKQTNIVIRQGSMLDLDTDLTGIAVIRGSLSGLHAYDALISDDKKTLVLNPIQPFTPGETVEVTVNPGLRSQNGTAIGGLIWSFSVSPKTTPLMSRSDWLEYYGLADNISEESPEYRPNDTRDISLPENFPTITVTTIDNPNPGYIFLSNFYGSPGQYLMILDNTGTPVFYYKTMNNSFDFKKQPNGILTYYDYGDNKFHAFDSTYTVIDSFYCGNGYEEGTDPHDMQILSNGHILMIANDPQIIDMSDSVECGLHNAQVIGLIIQELDTLKNVVWQWQSWDHFSVFDATYDINLCGLRIDYVHGNAVELDDDGNLLLSSRNLSEITKIDRTTGDIIWRWGGENNEFTFINDSRGFSHQHDIRRLPNGNVTLFDNGNLLSPQYSRALEYELDEVNKIATLVWEYRQTPDVFAGVMGNTQRLASGNTVIGWGSAHPSVTELHPNDSKALELTFSSNTISYRAFRFDWHGVAAKPSLIVEENDEYLHLILNKFGDSTVTKFYIYADTLPEPTVIIDSTSASYIDLYDLLCGYTYYFRITAADSLNNQSPFSNEVEATMPELGQLPFVSGDANMINGIWPPQVIGSDVTYLVGYFRNLPGNPPCLLYGFYAAADVNGDCLIIGSDVTKLVNYFRTGEGLLHCPDYPPMWPDPENVPIEPPEDWPACQ
jgi:hypothetical protein